MHACIVYIIGFFFIILLSVSKNINFNHIDRINPTQPDSLQAWIGLDQEGRQNKKIWKIKYLEWIFLWLNFKKGI